MPVYVHAAFAVMALGLLTAVVAPAPRMPLPRAARACRALMAVGGVVLVAALSLPAFDVWYPALAGSALAAFVWLTMFWLARQPDLFAAGPEAVAEAEDHDDPGDDDGGGGGGGPPKNDPPPGPSSPDGIDWESFDRQRQGWEQHTPVGV